LGRESSRVRVLSPKFSFFLKKKGASLFSLLGWVWFDGALRLCVLGGYFFCEGFGTSVG
jgi:hypothetical protein